MNDSSKKTASIFRKSHWIWPKSLCWDIHNGYAVFRKKFILSKIPDKAPLFLTADQSYQLYVNGEYVCRGPARGFQKTWAYDEIDIHPFLKQGNNILAIRAYNPGCGNFQYQSQGFAGLLLSAKWGKIRMVSDADWKCRRQSGIQRDTVPTSVQLFCQEYIDLREENPQWVEWDFDDSSWIAPACYTWNSMPWDALQARGMPMLEEKVIQPLSGLGMASGRSAPSYKTTRDICRIRFQEGLAHRPSAFHPHQIRVQKTGKGRLRSFLIDFEKVVVGSVVLEITGAQGGEILDTLHAETIDLQTLTPHFQPDSNSRLALGHRLICRAGPQTHAFYHSLGFRYMVLTLRDSPSPLEISVSLRTTMYPLEKKGSFQSSDSTLQDIWDACVWTQRICSMDAYVDTPWREQAQWWGDARVQAKNTVFYSGDLRLFRRGISQIAGQTTPDGLTYGHSPTIAHNCILPDFTLIWMITLWDFYWYTGSTEPFLAHQATLQRALNYFEPDPKTGLVGYDSRYWLFLDWTNLFKEGYSTVFNLWILIAMEKVAELYRRAGQRNEARSLTGKAKNLRNALKRLLREDGLLSDGLTFRNKLVHTTSIHAQTLAILAGFDARHHPARVRNILLPYLRGQLHPDAQPSSYWITYVFEVLTATGYGNEVVQSIAERWRPMAAYGSTWETFAPQMGHESHSHAWSAHPLYHLMQTVGGIRQTEAAWSKILFQPVFLGDHAETIVSTPKGRIISRWEKQSKEIFVELKLPAGVTAQVNLSNKKRMIVTGRNKWKTQIKDLPAYCLPAPSSLS